MSDVAQAARVSLFVCDYAAIDGANKINGLGIGWQGTGIDPATGSTAPQSVVLLVDVPASYAGETFALELGLHDESGSLVSVPGPMGEPQQLRISQPTVAEAPVLRGQKGRWSRAQWVLNFPAGLPLAPGAEYTWRAKIDGDDDQAWGVSFAVVGPPVPPIIG